MDITFLEADQDWNEETTTYWFEFREAGVLYHDVILHRFGIVESGGESTIIDPDGRLVTGFVAAIVGDAVVTAEIRARAAGLS